MWRKLKDRLPGIAENAAWDAIKWLFGILFIAFFLIVPGWIKGVSGMMLLDIFAIVFVSVLFVVIFVQLRRLHPQPEQAQGSSPSFVNVDQQSHIFVVPDIQPLKNAPYLSSRVIRTSSSYFKSKEEAIESAILWTLSITNDLLSSDVRAAEATGVCAELTYYDAKWQRLFGPVQGGWMVNKGRGGDSENYLNTDLITLGPQETHNLAIVIRMSIDSLFFALSKESLPFFCWRNPAFKLDNQLDNHYMLQVVLKGDVVQRTFHFHLRCVEKGNLSIIQALLPEE